MTLNKTKPPNEVSMKNKPSGHLSLVIAGAITFSAVARFRRWLSRHKFVPREVEGLTHALGEVVDDNEEAEDEEEDEHGGLFGDLFREEFDTQYDMISRRAGTTRRKVRLVTRVAIELKVKFGSCEDNSSNSLMMSDYARKYMADMGVRPTHITQAYPVAVRLALTPSASDILSAQMTGTKAYTSRMVLAHTQWQTRPWYLDLLPGMGGRRIGLPPTGA